MLSENSVEWLSEYLVGNWFPIDDYCLYGDDALLSKLIESVLLCVLRSDGSEDEVEEIQPLYLGLTTRYKWSCDSAEDQSTFDQFLEVVITRACCLVSDRLGLHQHPRPDDPYGSENSSYLEEFAKHVLSSEGVRFDPLSKGRADAYLSENTVENSWLEYPQVLPQSRIWQAIAMFCISRSSWRQCCSTCSRRREMMMNPKSSP